MANPEWKALSIQVPGQDLLEGARGALEALMLYLEVTKTILETVKVFLVDFGNPIKALVEALLQLILDLFAALQREGLYAWFDIPNPLKDPNFNRHLGGFRAFTERFKQGLLDPRDPNRPQPYPGAHVSGYMLIVADADEPLALMRYIEVLLRFFGKEFTAPRYQAPSSLRVLPVGRGRDPILNVTRIYQFQPTSIAVEWSLPQTETPGDPGFSDLIQAASTNFVPPRFLIEKSEINPAVGKLTVDQLGDVDAVGQVVMKRPSEFLVQGKQGPVEREVRLTDQHGDPFIKFQKYIIVDATHNTGTFLLGQLGTFRWIDEDVEQNKTYYYRVRAYSGELAVDGTTLIFKGPSQGVTDKNPYIEWPGPADDKPMMGRSSPIVQIMIPTYPEKFDVIETLRRLFQVAFSLNFHLPLPVGAKFNEQGYPVEPTLPSDIGKGVLTNLAGPLTSYTATPIVGQLSKLNVQDPYGRNAKLVNADDKTITEAFQRDPASGKLPKQPWNESRVVRNAARLANIVAGAMLAANTAVGFKNLMEGPFPRGVPTVDGLTATNLLEMVYQITDVQDPEADGERLLQLAGVLYSNLFDDPVVRLNLVAAVGFCKSFTLVGSDSNWIQVSVLRDIVPWSGQMIYELLAKMQALVDAYAGVMAELRAFIDLIVRKIDVLERLLQYLTSILDFVASLSLGFYVLNVPSTNEGVAEWIKLLDNAEGTPPTSGAGGYSAGVALAYVGADVRPYADALKLIF